MMHSTLSSEEALHATGWMHPLVEFARPFRIPAFFLIAGLFASRGIDKDWRSFLDSKILHFAYFYVLWLTIQFVFRGPVYVAQDGDRRGAATAICSPSSIRSERCGSSICCRCSSWRPG